MDLYSTEIQWIGFVFGMMIGSFANVCIYRLPLSLNIIAPRSHCGQCKTPISWFENIPVFSFLLLRGRCRHCGISIGILSPVVEVLSGLMVLLSIHFYGLSFAAFYISLLLISLLVISFIDIDYQIIPDSISIGGMFLGLIVAIIFQCSGKSWFVSIQQSLLGIIVGGGFLWLIASTYEKLTGKEGMGFGDVKLVAFFGANAGWQATLVSIFIGSLIGSLVGLFIIVIQKKHRRTPIPFGPFLCTGFVLYFLDMLNIIHIPIEWLGSYDFHF